MLLMISTACAVRSPVAISKAVNGVHENGCICEGLSKDANEYEFLGVDTLADIDGSLDFCEENKFLSAGTLNALKRTYDEHSIVSATTCNCEGLAEPIMSQIVLFEREYLEAVNDALQECRQNLFESVE